MKNNNKKQKAFVLSVTMAALMLSPITSNAQYNENKYGLQEWGKTSLLGKQDGQGSLRGDGDMSITAQNQTFGQAAPLGSGLVVLLGAGLGYVALKKKEDEQ